MSRCGPADTERAGFGLVEVVIVVACAAATLAVSVPNLPRLEQTWELWGGAHLVESSLQWGRMHAITANTSVIFKIDQDGRRFYWADPVTGDPYSTTMRYLPGRVRIVGFPQKPLRYFQRGNAVPAGTFTLQGEAGVYRVIVNPGGRIRIQKD
jgi:type II secretion system GspH-like protein